MKKANMIDLSTANQHSIMSFLQMCIWSLILNIRLTRILMGKKACNFVTICFMFHEFPQLFTKFQDKGLIPVCSKPGKFKF